MNLNDFQLHSAPPLLPSRFPLRPRAPFKALIPILGSACTVLSAWSALFLSEDPNLAHSSKLKLNTILPEKPCLWTQETIACSLSYLVPSVNTSHRVYNRGSQFNHK